MSLYIHVIQFLSQQWLYYAILCYMSFIFLLLPGPDWPTAAQSMLKRTLFGPTLIQHEQHYCCGNKWHSQGWGVNSPHWAIDDVLPRKGQLLLFPSYDRDWKGYCSLQAIKCLWGFSELLSFISTAMMCGINCKLFFLLLFFLHASIVMAIVRVGVVRPPVCVVSEKKTKNIQIIH